MLVGLKPLKVLCLVKNTPSAYRREDRPMGMWSYPVEQFTWDFISPGKHFDLNLERYQKQGYDLVFHEDGGSWGTFSLRRIPIIYYSIDSTLTEQYHYYPRLAQAAKADLILIDHDQLDRFALKAPVRRFSYCVNDWIFHPVHDTRTADVVFHCSGTEERANVRSLLDDLCKRHGWTYRSGTLGLEDYARSMATARVVVNLPRTPLNRPHRVFDAMACETALLTFPLPQVDGERKMAGRHYAVVSTGDNLEGELVKLLDCGGWLDLARAGYDLVCEHHTWRVRARELRLMIREVFGL